MALPIPPQQLRFMGEDERGFLEIGDGLLTSIRALSGFRADGAIVDVGSGYGRLAHALLRSGFQGTYRGLEILRPHVDWAQQNLGNDRFSFSHLNIRNPRYNPHGTLDAANVKLQDHASRCDLIVLTSVFTHMYEPEIENYFSCFARMLHPGGQIVCTFFLLTPERHEAISKGESRLALPFVRPPVARYHNESDPLHAIAFEQQWVEQVAQRNGFALQSVTYGHWCNGQSTRDRQYQDFITLRMA